MKIQSLLNPFCGEKNGNRSSESPTPASTPRTLAPITPTPKRQKIPKDAPVFSEGNKVVGHVNYPPFETCDDPDLEKQHRRFQVYPLGEIYKKGIRHIPYNSDKKDFMEKTARESFEMFQYTYKVPGDDKLYTVVWDYNVGLVRMTPFFKSCKYSKTIPAKALRENPGLKDISYSITGGALLCQGYWMPYQAAKAIAATFCYNIRWALTPVFGPDFPSACLHPRELSFAKFLIDPAIVMVCTHETNRFRIEGDAYKILRPDQASPTSNPKTRFASPTWTLSSSSSTTSTTMTATKGSRKQLPAKPADIESGYGTDTDQSDKYLFSPQVSPRTQTWTSVNRSQSPSSPPAALPPTANPCTRTLPPLPARSMLPTSVPGGFYDGHYHHQSHHHHHPFNRPPQPHLNLGTKRTLSKVAIYEVEDQDDDDYYVEHSRPATADTDADSELRLLPRRERNGGHHGHGYTDGDGDGAHHTRKELDAAEIILQLSSVDQSLPPPTKRTRRGSRC
ncbi:hypothetical protein BS50DRAFT_505119 [Corynespora cassiicola Philippines]|uniref:HTH APSES-type domain-containing protein n=1 Tax=Corynespora cassiicola Philippines TaxID=1448308 RepID=A0A2T2N7G4_CORCC|nr:hypothetical protein BS50DRAFT_505119 [Corynespora cassiicola Philippines]